MDERIREEDRDGSTLLEEQRCGCQNGSEGCDGSFNFQSWWTEKLQPTNQALLEKVMDETEWWLLIGIPNRDPFFLTQYFERYSASSDQHLKKLMSLREGLHVMMHCCMRQYFC